MNQEQYITDIPAETASRAYDGVSMFPERRAESSRNEYAQTMAEDFETLRKQAEKGGTLDLLQDQFDRYRAGYRKRYLAYLHSSARCVSWFIAGLSNFPARRMQKRSDIAHARLNEFLDYRSRALASIKRTLRPDLRAIYAGDGDAIERLEAKITQAEAYQQRMKVTNATIRRHAKEGLEAQIAALLAMGYQELTARKLLRPDFCGRIGFANWELTNNNANLRRMRQRLESISIAQATPSAEIEGDQARVEDCPAENRVRLFFPGKPDVDVRTSLKRSGFRWAPSLGCWQAYRNSGTVAAAKRFAGVAEQSAA